MSAICRRHALFGFIWPLAHVHSAIAVRRRSALTCATERLRHTNARAAAVDPVDTRELRALPPDCRLEARRPRHRYRLRAARDATAAIPAAAATAGHRLGDWFFAQTESSVA